MELKVKEFELPKDCNFSENEEKGLKQLGGYIKSLFEEVIAGMKSAEEITADVKSEFEKLGLTGEKLVKLEKALKEQGTALATMKNIHGGSAQESVGAQIKAFVESDDAKGSASKRQSVGADISIKDASTMFTTNAKPAIELFNTAVESTIHDVPSEENAVYTRLLKGTIGSPKLEWANRVNKEGGAEWTPEGGLKPLMDWEYETESTEAKKITVATKVSTEMLQDAPFMRSEIQLLLTKDLLEKVNKGVITGTGTGNEILGVTTNAAGYTNTELNGKVEKPNFGDAIRASVLQMRLLNFRPDTLFVNPTDKALLDLTKDSTGHYLASEINALMRGITIVETANIEAGKFLLMDASRWYVRVYDQLRLEYGWENDDFRKNLVTVIAEMRLMSYQHSVDKGSVVYDSFDTVIDAIEAA